MNEMEKKRASLITAYLPAFSFTLAYLVCQYLHSGISLTASPDQILRPLLVFYALFFVCGFVVHKIIKDHTKAGLTLWLIAEICLFSQPFFLISGISAVILVLVWIGIMLLRKKKIFVNQISFMLAVLGFGLVISVSVRRIQWDVVFEPIPEKIEVPSQSLIVPEQAPDIYYIVVDAYTDSRILEELYDFNNSEFTDYLLAKGFIIPDENYSNYALTAFSVSSTLNMEYIQTLLPTAEKWTKWWLVDPLVEDSRVKTMFEESGYQTIAIATDWNLMNIQSADLYLAPFPVQLNEFEKLLIQTSPLQLLTPVFERFMSINSYASHRETVEYSFATLLTIPDISGPKFVFTHITAPHTPFAFTSEGDPITPSYEFSFIDASSFPGTREEYILGYVEQVKYVNQQLEQVVDSILENSENPPIIILMSDHGSRLLTDYVNPTNTCIHEAHSNFAAFYLPGAGDDVIPDDITPVNVFRIIFDEYFGTEFGLLENEYYFSSDGYQYFQFDDVSSRIHQECDLSSLE